MVLGDDPGTCRWLVGLRGLAVSRMQSVTPLSASSVSQVESESGVADSTKISPLSRARFQLAIEA